MRKTEDGYGVIPNEVLYSDLPDAAVRLFCIISSHSNRYGYCTASNEYLAKKINKTERSISRLLKRLEKYLVVTRSKSQYRRIQPVEKYCSGTTKMSTRLDKNVVPGTTKMSNIIIQSNNTIGKRDVSVEKALERYVHKPSKLPAYVEDR